MTKLHYVADEKLGGYNDGSPVTLSPEDYKTISPPGRVLNPAEPSQNTDVLELIANLAKTVAKQQKEIERLERDRKYANELTAMRLDSSTDDIRTFAEEFTEFKAEARKQMEEQAFLNDLLLDDIALLDERTSPEELTKAIAELVANGSRAKGYRNV